MADRLYNQLAAALSSYSIHGADEFEEEEEGTEDGDYEEAEGIYDICDEGSRVEDLACPFCNEDFDVLGLCCHIDADHRMEVKLGICPVCGAKVVVGNMASHVITHHENVLKCEGDIYTLSYKKHQSIRSRSAISTLRKDLQEKHLRIINQQSVDSPRGKPAVDTMLLSFVNNPRPENRDQPPAAASSSSSPSMTEKTSSSSISTRGTDPNADSLPSERTEPCFQDEKGRRRRCEYLQGLVLSAILDDYL